MKLGLDFKRRFLSLLDSIGSSSSSRGQQSEDGILSQLDYFMGNELVSGTVDDAKEVFTGKFFTGADGVERKVYKKAVHADSFQTANSYGWIQVGIPFEDKIVPIMVEGYVDGLYATYAHYWYMGVEGEDKPTSSVRWFWTASGEGRKVQLILTYAK